MNIQKVILPNTIRRTFVSSAAIFCLLILLCGPARIAAQTQDRETGRTATLGYKGLVQQAKQQIAAGKFSQAEASAEKAIRIDPTRIEAHIIAAAALKSQSHYQNAIQHLNTALSLAPNELKGELLRAITEVRISSLPPDARSELEDAMSMIVAARSDTDATRRNNSLRTFMARSSSFLDDHSFVPELWLLRAAAAIELGEPELGGIAGRKLIELGVAASSDPTVRSVMAQLKDKGWLDRSFALPKWSSEVSMGAVVNAAASVGVSSWESEIDRTETYLAALKFYRTKAEMGSASASRMLAFMYANGLGTLKDLTEAFRWVSKAAVLGDVIAQIWLAEAYHYGFGSVKQDPAESIHWYKAAASQNNPFAEQGVGFNFRNGEGVAPNDAEAMSWFKKAARDAREQGFFWITNSMAWLFSTDPEPQFRDGNLAVQYATAACESNSYKDSNWVDTLAAAYAERGDWDLAVKTEQKAIDILTASGTDIERYLEGYKTRLALYESGQQYREKQEQFKDIFGEVVAQQQNNADLMITQLLNDAKTTKDSEERYKKLLALTVKFPAKPAFSNELKLTAQTVADELPKTIAAQLNALGRMRLKTREGFISSTIEYNTKPLTCGISIESTQLDNFQDGEYVRTAFSGKITFPYEKKRFRTTSLRLEDPTDGSNLYVHIDDSDNVKVTRFEGTYRPQKEGPEYLGGGSNDEIYYSFLLAPDRREEAKLLNDRLSTLEDACSRR
jgi:tetratricopeptide (TPR) repeat protein